MPLLYNAVAGSLHTLLELLRELAFSDAVEMDKMCCETREKAPAGPVSG